MRKGDKRKHDILRTAERLFYTMGYESATIQDIIDSLKLSKGGFYHHFESKESLLSALCEEKLEYAFLDATEAASRESGATAMLNTLLDRRSVYKEEHVRFIGLLIRVAYRDDNLFMRENIHRKTEENMLPVLSDIIRLGVSQGSFFTPYPDDIGRVILFLVNTLDDEIANILLKADTDSGSLMEILGRLDFYRHVIERLLEAPYASIIIYDMGTLSEVCRAVLDRQRHETWESLESTQRVVNKQP